MGRKPSPLHSSLTTTAPTLQWSIYVRILYTCMDVDGGYCCGACWRVREMLRVGLSRWFWCRSHAGHMQVTCPGHMQAGEFLLNMCTSIWLIQIDQWSSQSTWLSRYILSLDWLVVCIPTTISLNGTSIYMHLWLFNMTPPHPPLRLWCVEVQNNIMCDYHLSCKSLRFWYWSKPGFLQLCPLKVKRCLINVDAMCTEVAGRVR